MAEFPQLFVAFQHFFVILLLGVHLFQDLVLLIGEEEDLIHEIYRADRDADDGKQPEDIIHPMGVIAVDAAVEQAVLEIDGEGKDHHRGIDPSGDRVDHVPDRQRVVFLRAVEEEQRQDQKDAAAADGFRQQLDGVVAVQLQRGGYQPENGFRRQVQRQLDQQNAEKPFRLQDHMRNKQQQGRGADGLDAGAVNECVVIRPHLLERGGVHAFGKAVDHKYGGHR